VTADHATAWPAEALAQGTSLDSIQASANDQIKGANSVRFGISPA